MKICLPSLISAALCCSPLLASAGDNPPTNAGTFQPASFNFSPSTLESALADIDLPANAPIAVYCQSDISEQGANLRTHCFEKDGHTKLETAIEGAIASLNFTPATADGDYVAVRMNYRVVYQNHNDGASVMLIPNIGTLQKELGINYSEPQQRLDLTGKLGENTFFEHGARLIRASANISTQGTTKEVAVVSKGTPKEDVALIDTIKGAQFIPGFVNNTPVEMTYLAIIAKES